MQAWKTKILLSARAAAFLLLPECGPGTRPEARGPASPEEGAVEGLEGGAGRPVTGLVCESSDDCGQGMICVDGECMIPEILDP
jgi:hypothetical protein